MSNASARTFYETEALRGGWTILGLRDEYSESELEHALVRHLENFLLELGGDFTFVGRQRRLRVGNASISSFSIARFAASS